MPGQFPAFLFEKFKNTPLYCLITALLTSLPISLQVNIMKTQYSAVTFGRQLSLSIFFALFTNNLLASASDQVSDPNASDSARAVQTYLAALSNNNIPGVIAGQMLATVMILLIPME